MKNLREFYTDKTCHLETKIRELKQKNRYFIGGEITSFLLFIAFVAFFATFDGQLVTGTVAVVSLLAYILIRRMDVRNSARIDYLTDVQSVYQKELSYVNGDFISFGDGEAFIDAHHPFTFDMDVFGPDSLFNRMNRTITTGGNRELARSLAHLPNEMLKKEEHPDDILKLIDDRREAINELAEMEPWRTEFLSLGQRMPNGIDSAAILHSLDKVKEMHIPAFFRSTVSVIISILSLLGFFTSVILSIFTNLSANIPVLWATLQFFVVFMLCSGPLRTVSKAVNALHGQLKAYIGIISLMSSADFHSAGNNTLKKELKSSDTDAMLSFGQLKGILDGLDRRGNVLGLVIFNIIMLSDFFLVRRFLKWQNMYMGRINDWVGAVSKMDSLVSMATFRYNEPLAGNAEIKADAAVVYEAHGLYHPFLGTKAIKNDFIIKDGNYYIVTGANMAGKSTFLRSIGVNYILAMNGMPVFADSLKVSVFNFFSSMRTTDDLTHGISYFNAELLRLKQLIDSCRQSDRTLIILDEILKGTNSLDKLNGSRLFLQSISQLPVTGVIATHDLELSKMEEEYPGRFLNYCFEIELGTDVTYTYKITRGVARNQNATFLLKEIIK